ncbi:MAG: DUF4922 domain-containing protein [Muribaculaceae bacterium]
MNNYSEQVEKLIEQQLVVWQTPRDNYAALQNVEVKEFKVKRSTIKVQFNPARIVSSAAKVDNKSLKERKCFLCAANRPEVQEGIAWGENYTILINPFPIFPKHLTIPCNDHTDQRILSRIGDMMAIAKDLPGYTLFYNGPKCGASAPDHMHFQAGNRGFLGFETDYLNADKKEVISNAGATLSLLSGLANAAFLIEAVEIDAATELFVTLYNALDIPEGEEEPMLNILCWSEEGKWKVAVFPRRKHRPACYSAEGDANILISPASVDMGGVFITPLEKDFKKITADDLEQILDEVCLDQSGVEKILNNLK